MLFILALAVGIIAGLVTRHNLATYGLLARIAGAVAGFIVGFWGTILLIELLESQT